VPTRKYRTFLFDFEVCPGNSGGPVFLADSVSAMPRPGLVLQRKSQAIMGMVTQRVATTQKDELKLGVVIPATLIKDTIDALPPVRTTVPEEEVPPT